MKKVFGLFMIINCFLISYSYAGYIPVFTAMLDGKTDPTITYDKVLVTLNKFTDQKPYIYFPVLDSLIKKEKEYIKDKNEEKAFMFAYIAFHYNKRLKDSLFSRYGEYLQYNSLSFMYHEDHLIITTAVDQKSEYCDNTTMCNLLILIKGNKVVFQNINPETQKIQNWATDFVLYNGVPAPKYFANKQDNFMGYIFRDRSFGVQNMYWSWKDDCLHEKYIYDAEINLDTYQPDITFTYSETTNSCN